MNGRPRLLAYGAVVALLLGLSVLSAGAAQAAVEPNGTRANAQPIAVGIADAMQGQIAPAGDQDWYRFNGTAGGTYVAEVYNVASGLGPMSLTGFNASGTVLANAGSCNGSRNACAHIQFTTSLAGTYLLQTRGYFSANAGTYSMRVLPG